MRLFDLSAVRGLWGSEPTPPSGEWTAIDIRRQTLRRIEASITRAEYTDAPPLAVLPAQPVAARQALDQVRLIEANIARLEDKILDLQQRILVANNNTAYQNELTQKSRRPCEPASAAQQRHELAERHHQRSAQVLHGACELSEQSLHVDLGRQGPPVDIE